MNLRIERLRASMAEQALPAVLIQNPTNVGYLSGFTGSTAALLVTPDACLFLTDSRYRVQAAAECPGFEIAITPAGSGSYPPAIADAARRLGLRRLAFESDHTTVAALETLQASMREIELVPVRELVARLRQVKDPEEVVAIREACAIADRTFDFALTILRPGAVEREVAADLEYFMRKAGSDEAAFETIVASGPRSALPHGRASDRRIEPGDLVTLDFGARVRGYCSDITRTVVIGPASKRQREVYGLVLEAELAGIDAARAGAEGKAVDAVARERITQRGCRHVFGHGLGHGLGRSVHDHLALSQTSGLILEPGMVLTVEPGIYIEGWGGVRIEDDVLVTEGEPEVLTRAPKHLIELPVG